MTVYDTTSEAPMPDEPLDPVAAIVRAQDLANSLEALVQDYRALQHMNRDFGAMAEHVSVLQEENDQYRTALIMISGACLSADLPVTRLDKIGEIVAITFQKVAHHDNGAVRGRDAPPPAEAPIVGLLGRVAGDVNDGDYIAERIARQDDGPRDPND